MLKIASKSTSIIVHCHGSKHSVLFCHWFLFLLVRTHFIFSCFVRSCSFSPSRNTLRFGDNYQIGGICCCARRSIWKVWCGRKTQSIRGFCSAYTHQWQQYEECLMLQMLKINCVAFCWIREISRVRDGVCVYVLINPFEFLQFCVPRAICTAGGIRL